VDDVAQAAKDWPQLNFLVYHSGYRHVGGNPDDAMAEFERDGRIAWVSDLADIPAKHGVTNVYGDLGQLFAHSTVAHPKVAAALMGILIKGLGVSNVVWGTDAVWTGSPQWQIEGLRRMEIPEDMQQRHGFAPLGDADGPVKRAIFGENNARLYNVEVKHASQELERDRFAAIKSDYEAQGAQPSLRRYGFMMPG
jgi:predicted TIM-barrel fold metal-dependent hydrolase